MPTKLLEYIVIAVELICLYILL